MHRQIPQPAGPRGPHQPPAPARPAGGYCGCRGSHRTPMACRRGTVDRPAAAGPPGRLAWRRRPGQCRVRSGVRARDRGPRRLRPDHLPRLRLARLAVSQIPDGVHRPPPAALSSGHRRALAGALRDGRHDRPPGKARGGEAVSRRSRDRHRRHRDGRAVRHRRPARSRLRRNRFFHPAGWQGAGVRGQRDHGGASRSAGRRARLQEPRRAGDFGRVRCDGPQSRCSSPPVCVLGSGS